MSGIALDASVALAWCFEDEGDPEADTLIERVASEGAAVPDLWFLEIANGLVVAERRGRMKPAESATFVAMVEALPIVAHQTSMRVLQATMSLAREHALTVYDAVYLEMAMRLGRPLATGDRKLAAAARCVGVKLAI